MDKGFERARKALQSKQKQLKQKGKGKGNKPNACVALGEDEAKLLDLRKRDHNNIDYSCLNRRGLHLNRKGSSLVSKNFSQYLNA